MSDRYDVSEAELQAWADGRLEASRRTVVVHVSTTGDPGVPDAVTAAVQRRLALLDPAPQVRVRATTGGAA